MFGMKNRLEKSLDQNTENFFQSYFQSMCNLLSPLSYEPDGKSGQSKPLYQGSNAYDFRIKSNSLDRYITISYLSRGRAAIYIGCTRGEFPFSSFLLEQWNIKLGPEEIYNNSHKYFDFYLDLFRKSLEVQEFRDVIEGKTWREWRKFDWEPYK